MIRRPGLPSRRWSSGIKHRRAYLEGLEMLPDWRITCFFVDSGYRRKGVSSIALGGALEEIGRSDGRRVAASFLHNGTLAMFESHGFERTRRIGKHRWVVARVVRLMRG